MNKNELLLKIWISTVSIAPILAITILGLIKSEDHFNVIGGLQILWLMILMGLFFSIPTILVLMSAMKLLSKNKYNFEKSFLIMSVISVLGILITFAILDKAFVSTHQFAFPLSYMITMVASIYYFIRKV